MLADSRAPHVVIAGGGIAAAATAIRLRALGLRVSLMIRELAPACGVEAVPRRALDLFHVLGEADVAAEAGAVEVEGPAHEWHRSAGRVPAPFVHVDRVTLATVLLSRAVMRGATVERVRRLPRPEDIPGDPVGLVDATGRAAAWSRPVVGHGRAVAYLFRAPAEVDMAGRVVRADGWWAYRLGCSTGPASRAGHTGATWLGVVSATGQLTPAMLDTAAERLGLSPASLVAQGRRPAGVQRAAEVVAGRRIAVGDAALAHDPIAGQGIRFALGSAIAAATTLATWADDPSQRDVASEYYRDLVAAEERRHLDVLGRLGEADAPAPAPGRLPAIVQVGATVVDAPLSVDGHVEVGPALRLPDGTTTRWAGTFDLLDLARIAANPTPRVLVVAQLLALGLDLAAARMLVAWAVGSGVLIDAGSSTSDR